MYRRTIRRTKMTHNNIQCADDSSWYDTGNYVRFVRSYLIYVQRRLGKRTKLIKKKKIVHLIYCIN